MPGGLIGVRLPVEDENADEPWKMTPSRRRQAPPIKGPLPDDQVVLADQVYIDRTGLPSVTRCAARPDRSLPEPGVLSRPGHAAADLRQAADHLVRRTASASCGIAPRLPRRGDGAHQGQRRETAFVDERQRGTALDVTFLGKLHGVQAGAVAALEPHDFGVLAATTAFGKTVVGAA